MDLQDIPLNTGFRVMNLSTSEIALLFNKSVKIQDGCQSDSIIPAADFFSMLHYQLFWKKGITTMNMPKQTGFNSSVGIHYK